LGRKVRIVKESLKPGDIEVHRIYYSSQRPNGFTENKFFIGLLTVIHQRNLTLGDSAPVTLKFVEDPYNYEQFIRTFKEQKQLSISKSSYSDFDFYNNQLFMK